MELIKRIDSVTDEKGKSHTVGIFKCPVCGAEVTRILYRGYNSKTCSRKCSTSVKLYKPWHKGERTEQPKVEKTPSLNELLSAPKDYKVPELCKTCVWWRRVAVSAGSLSCCHHLYYTGVMTTGKDCRAEGYYKPRSYRKRNEAFYPYATVGEQNEIQSN